MNRAELITALAQRTELSKSTAEAVLAAFGDVLLEAVARGEAVTVPGLFSLERAERAARTGRNPQTGQSIDIPAGYSAKLSAGSKLKAAASGS